MKTVGQHLVALLCLALLLAAQGAYAGGTVTSSADPWEPFVDPNDSGNGISIAIITAAFETQGYTFEHQFQPWKRSMNDVRTSVVDVLPGTWLTEERTQFLRYSDPYIVNNIKLIKRKDDPFNYTGLDSIAGMKVGTVAGYGYPDAFTNSQAVLDPAIEFSSAIKKLLAGRVSFAIEDEIVAKYKINQNDPSDLEKVEFLEPALSENPLHVTCALENPRCEEIINAFNKGLAAIKESGEFDRILERYGIK